MTAAATPRPRDGLECEVLVAGAGPVGAVMAWALHQAGIDVRVVEALPACAEDLRASTFHPP
ncbi:MAG: FAD-dependent oxidoreductase, partial [Sphingomonadaceae bacterium]